MPKRSNNPSLWSLSTAQRINVRSGAIRTVQIPHIDLLGIEGFEGAQKVLPKMLRFVGPLIFVHSPAHGRVVFRVHYNAAVLPVQLAQSIFRGAPP